MTRSTTDPTAIEGFHAHVYFKDETGRSKALALRAAINRRFRNVTLGRVHDRKVGFCWLERQRTFS